ncbi:hypothetical protein P245_19665 [Comamonas thiooxydans]|uniref:Uncharacterized protein n=1 Tax=Comamonas thiooxydans TaxID=363952 RepID=A0A0E3BYE9_9BURK|nr:hypothetical protein P245_19665 [Comamonas thiooxydans]
MGRSKTLASTGPAASCFRSFNCGLAQTSWLYKISQCISNKRIALFSNCKCTRKVFKFEIFFNVGMQATPD